MTNANGTFLYFPIAGPEWDVLKQPVFLKYIVFSLRLRYKDVESVWGAQIFDPIVPQFRFIEDGRDYMLGKLVLTILGEDRRGPEGPFVQGKVWNAGVFSSPDGLRAAIDFPGGENVRPRFEAMREEILRLIELLSAQPAALPRLANLSDADVDVINQNFREINRWALVYSGREIDERERDKIKLLLQSKNTTTQRRGKRLADEFLKEKKAKDALQIVYLNQYADFLRRYGFLGDEHRGPRGACTVA